MSTTVNIIGFPMDLGAGRRGVDMGPSALRKAGVADKLVALGYDVHDDGDIPVENPETQRIENKRMRYLPAITRAVTIMAQKTESILYDGGFPLAIGGDHSMAIGTIAGVALHCRRVHKRLGVIWIDAHSDINTPETSPSGNIHGMPLAVTLGMGPLELTRVGGEFPKVSPQNVALIGLRDLDEGEKQTIKRLQIQSYTMTDIDKSGAHAVITAALADLHTKVDHLHVSFDLDSVDPSVAPGVGTPVAGGLTYREAHLIMEEIADSGFMHSLDIVEINPILDNRNQTAEFAAEIIASCMGKRIL